jgi:uncharacterized protein YhhL (DUF1145 family)
LQKPDAADSLPPSGSTSTNLTNVASVAVWFLSILNLYHFRIADPDLWWYLRCGGDILQSGHIRQLDIYSFTAAGLPYLDHEWLTQVLFAFLVNHGGSLAFVALKMIVGIALLVMLYRLIRFHTSDPRIYLPFLLLGAHAVGRFLLFRPQIFSFLFFTITLYVLELDRRKQTRAVWILPLLLWLWANMHAAFAVGMALIGYYWLIMPWAGANGSRKLSFRLGLVALVAFGLTLLNPFGISLWQGVFGALADPLNRTYVDEWQPTYLSPLKWNSLVYFGLVLLVLLGTLAARARKWAEVLLIAIFAVLAISAPRHVPFFAIVALPSLAKWITEWTNHIKSVRGANLVLASGLGIILLPVLLTSYYTVTDPLPRARIRDDHYRGFPYQAAEFLRRQPVTGNVWSELAWGGYFVWKLSPAWKVSLDGRNMAVYPRQVVQDHLELTSGPSPDLSVLDRYPIDVCVFGRERKVVPMLKSNRDWELIYEDDVAVAFRNRRSAKTGLLKQDQVSLPDRPAELCLEDVLK